MGDEGTAKLRGHQEVQHVAADEATSSCEENIGGNKRGFVSIDLAVDSLMH